MKGVSVAGEEEEVSGEMDTVDDDVVAGSGTFFFIEVVFDGKEIESGLGEEGD